MTPTSPDTLYALIREIRTGFNRLKTLSDTMNGGDGVTAAMRAVLEYLVACGPATVPRIARDKSVTRQHVQQLADALVAAKLAVFTENPEHKRSKLVAVTELGHTTFAAMQAREARFLADLATGLDAEAVTTARETLARLNEALTRLDSSGV